MSLPQVAVVVLNWNRTEDTLACLDSLLKQQAIKSEIVLVDNGSTDSSVKTLREQFPSVKIIETGANLGYAGGNNIGIQYALDQGSEYTLILNNDTVLATDSLSRLVADLSLYPDVAAAGPKSLYFEDREKIYFAGGRIGHDGSVVHIGSGSHDGATYNQPCDTEWLTGCAILFRNDALRKVGLFDPDYYLLYEDVDWCLRARKAGYRLRFVPGAKLWHNVSLSFGRTWSPIYMYYYTRNYFLWIERNFSFRQKPRLYYFAFRRALGNILLRNSVLVPADKHRVRRAVLKAIVDYLRRKFGQQYNLE